MRTERLMTSLTPSDVMSHFTNMSRTVLREFWDILCHWAEAREWFEEVLTREGALTRTAERAKALNAASRFARLEDDHVSARRFSEEALSISRELGDKREIA